MVDLNFRVPKSFRKAFKQAALDQDKPMRQILPEMFAVWQKHRRVEK